MCTGLFSCLPPRPVPDSNQHHARVMVTTLGNPTRPHLAALYPPATRSQGQVTGCPAHPPHHVGSGPVPELGRCTHPTHSPNQLPRTPAVASRDPPAVRSRAAGCGPAPSLYFTLYSTLLGMPYPTITRGTPPHPPPCARGIPTTPRLSRGLFRSMVAVFGSAVHAYAPSGMTHTPTHPPTHTLTHLGGSGQCRFLLRWCYGGERPVTLA